MLTFFLLASSSFFFSSAARFIDFLSLPSSAHLESSSCQAKMCFKIFQSARSLITYEYSDSLPPDQKWGKNKHVCRKFSEHSPFFLRVLLFRLQPLVSVLSPAVEKNNNNNKSRSVSIDRRQKVKVNLHSLRIVPFFAAHLVNAGDS